MQAAKAKQTPKQKKELKPVDRPRVTVQLWPDVEKMMAKTRDDGRTPTWLVNKGLRLILAELGYGK